MTIDYSQLMEAEKQVEMLFKEKGKELIFHNFARAESMVETISHLFKLDSTLREKVEEAKLKEAMIQIAKLKGSSNNNTSDKKLEEIRNKVFEEFEKNLK